MRCAHLLAIGGRSGAGKSSVGYAVSDLLLLESVAHAHIEGDNLCAAYPKPADDPLGTTMTERNLRALWGAYAALGHTRLVYTNTVSVLEVEMLVRAMTQDGGEVDVTAVLLTADDPTAYARLRGRERGGELDAHVQRSAATAQRLDREAAPWVHRVATDGRTVADIAAELVAVTRWA